LLPTLARPGKEAAFWPAGAGPPAAKRSVNAIEINTL
jgi:hypothetical protein